MELDVSSRVWPLQRICLTVTLIHIFLDRLYTIDYDNIVSVHNGEEYHHGQITYSDYKSSNGVDLLRLNIDMALCILPDEQENFLKEISNLVNKYSK